MVIHVATKIYEMLTDNCWCLPSTIGCSICCGDHKYLDVIDTGKTREADEANEQVKKIAIELEQISKLLSEDRERKLRAREAINERKQISNCSLPSTENHHCKKLEPPFSLPE